MSVKEKVCYRILKTYSLIVDFEGTPHRVNIPTPIGPDERFKCWKERVLGDAVSDVVIYSPNQPNPRKKIKTLQNESNAEHLQSMFRALAREKNQKRVTAVDDAVESAVSTTTKRYATFSKDTVADFIEEHRENLEPSVREFLDRIVNLPKDDVDAEELFFDLLRNYNDAVRRFRMRG